MDKKQIPKENGHLTQMEMLNLISLYGKYKFNLKNIELIHISLAFSFYLLCKKTLTKNCKLHIMIYSLTFISSFKHAKQC